MELPGIELETLPVFEPGWTTGFDDFLEDLVAPAGQRRTFKEYIHSANPRLIFYPHVELIVAELQKVADYVVAYHTDQPIPENATDRLMIFAPLREGKSELVSRLFPGYILECVGTIQVGLASYGADLVEDLSRDARDNFQEAGGKIRMKSSAVADWKVIDGGGMWARGMKGALVGRGFDVGIIDDPIKGREAAESPAERKKVSGTYDTDFRGRANPGAALIIMMTRWNHQDLAWHILKLEREAKRAERENWRIVVLEEVKTGNPWTDFPRHCKVIEDDRQPGQFISARYTPTERRRRKNLQGDYYYAALMQQRPAPEEGAMWKRHYFLDRVFQNAPFGLRKIGFNWDTAYTDDPTLSASAFVKAGNMKNGDIYVLEIDWRHVEFPELIDWMKSLPGPHYIEAKASGKSAKQQLGKFGVYATEVKVVSVEKEVNTRAVLPVGSSRKIWLHESVAERLLDHEEQGILRFPYGPKNDLNDAFVQMLMRLTGISAEDWEGAAMSRTR